jgi:hypothetical protein
MAGQTGSAGKGTKEGKDLEVGKHDSIIISAEVQ